MSTTRFTLLTVGLFGLAFVLVSWAQKGFPVIVYGYKALRPDPRLPTFERAVAKAKREDWEASKTSQSDGDPERDELRLALMQAATGYRLSPCDKTMKDNLVGAASRYIEAWYAKRFCKLAVDGCPRNDDDRSDAARAAFFTPADLPVHAEVMKAFEQGGIESADFPASIRKYVALFRHPPSLTGKAACHAAVAEKNRW